MNNKLMKKMIVASSVACVLSLSANANAAISSTVKLASDYTFNGVSQTDNKPALQASLDYAADSGFYTGVWASNVDFGDDTDFELDVYAGQYFQLNEKIGLDVGAAYYTYQGANSDGNYAEFYAKFGYNSSFGDSELNFWYAPDYFGADVGHYITMVAHTFEVVPGHNVKMTFDRSTSKNKNRWSWDGKSAYNHYRVEYMTNYSGFDFNVALEDTSMDFDIADRRVVFAVSRTFNF